MTRELIHADVLTWLSERQWLAQNGHLERFHAVLCDPPYGLEFMGREWDKPKPSGLMAKRDPREYAIPRYDGNYNGNKKKTNPFLGAKVNKYVAGVDYQAWVTEWATLLLDFVYPGAVLMAFGGTRTYHRLAAGLEDAGWEVADCIGFAWVYGSGFPKSHNLGNGYGTALKPAFEPVVLARAPRGNYTYAQLAQQFGTGALNIDGARIGTEEIRVDGRQTSGQKVYGAGKGFATAVEFRGGNHVGRWPANIILDEHAAEMLDEMSGESRSGGTPDAERGTRPGGFGNVGAAKGSSKPNGATYADTGGASRFYYTAKAAAWEKEAGLGYRKATPRSTARPNSPDHSGKFPDHDGRMRRNTHPTVKPLRLTEYLAKLLLPPESDAPRRILIPFGGVASEVIGAHLGGWDQVVGIEREAEYVEQGRARLAWWGQFSSYEKAQSAYEGERKAEQKEQSGQLPLFREPAS